MLVLFLSLHIYSYIYVQCTSLFIALNFSSYFAVSSFLITEKLDAKTRDSSLRAPVFEIIKK